MGLIIMIIIIMMMMMIIIIIIIIIVIIVMGTLGFLPRVKPGEAEGGGHMQGTVSRAAVGKDTQPEGQAW